MLADCAPIAFLATSDPGRARAFFRDALGLPLVGEDAFALVFETGGVALRVVTVPTVTPAPYTVLGWEVPDVAGALDALAAAGVAPERFPGLAQDARGVWASPSGARVAYFRDPDGNLLSISQLPESPGAGAGAGTAQAGAPALSNRGHG